MSGESHILSPPFVLMKLSTAKREVVAKQSFLNGLLAHLLRVAVGQYFGVMD